MPVGFGLLGALLGSIAGGVVVLASSANIAAYNHISGQRIAVYVGVGAFIGFIGGMIVGAELLGLLTKDRPKAASPPAEPVD